MPLEEEEEEEEKEMLVLINRLLSIILAV